MAKVRVTAEDVETGEKETVEIDHDYVLTVAGDCYLASTQTFANGTHVPPPHGVVIATVPA